MNASTRTTQDTIYLQQEQSKMPTNDSFELFYYKGKPTDLIYDGNHTKFTFTKVKNNKYCYIAYLDNLSFIHDTSHIIAVFELNKTNPTIYHCNERKENNNLHAAGKACKAI